METRRRYYPGGRVGGAARHGVRFSRSADDVDKARHEEVVGKSPHSARWQVGLVATQRTRHRRRRVQQVPSVIASNGNSNKLLRPGGGRRDDMPAADDSSTVAKIAADLRLSADGSAVRTSLVAGGG